MFILYAIPIGIALGLLVGGRPGRIADIRIRLIPLALAGLLIQVVLYSPLGDAVPLDVGRAIYVASTALVVVVVIANLRVAGIPLVVAGAATNLAAIVANGGAMPASPAALAAIQQTVRPGTNSVVIDHPVLEPLTDLFATPAWLPLANVFSIGDVLIGLGVVVAIAAAMRDPGDGRDRSPVEPSARPD